MADNMLKLKLDPCFGCKPLPFMMVSFLGISNIQVCQTQNVLSKIAAKGVLHPIGNFEVLVVHRAILLG